LKAPHLGGWGVDLAWTGGLGVDLTKWFGVSNI